MEASWQKAGALRMGDVTKSVTPKFGSVGPRCCQVQLVTRYFMLRSGASFHGCHGRTMPRVLCAGPPGTIAEGSGWHNSNETPANAISEHASGKIEVVVDYADTATQVSEIKSVCLIRTARKNWRRERCLFQVQFSWSLTAFTEGGE